jgi:hypothetical protein
MLLPRVCEALELSLHKKNLRLETLRKQLELRENTEILSKRRRPRTFIPRWLQILGAVFWIFSCLLQLYWHPETDRF